jgi:hypothetical protein
MTERRLLLEAAAGHRANVCNCLFFMKINSKYRARKPLRNTAPSSHRLAKSNNFGHQQRFLPATAQGLGEATVQGRIISLLSAAVLGAAFLASPAAAIDRRDIRQDRRASRLDRADWRSDRRDIGNDQREIAKDRRAMGEDLRNGNYGAARRQARDIRADKRDLRGDWRDFRNDNRDIRHHARDL